MQAGCDVSQFFLSVCETLYEEVKYPEEVVNCKTQSIEKCARVADGEEKKCKEIPKQVCVVKSITSVKHVPSTECKKMELPRKVCGPRLCPLVESEPVCEDRTKMVGTHVMNHIHTI